MCRQSGYIFSRITVAAELVASSWRKQPRMLAAVALMLHRCLHAHSVSRGGKKQSQWQRSLWLRLGLEEAIAVAAELVALSWFQQPRFRFESKTAHRPPFWVPQKRNRLRSQPVAAGLLSQAPSSRFMLPMSGCTAFRATRELLCCNFGTPGNYCAVK